MKKGNMPEAISNQAIFQNLMEAEVGNVGYKLGSRWVQLKNVQSNLCRAVDRILALKEESKMDYKTQINTSMDTTLLLEIMENILSEITPK
jgi:hypothetical protein